MKKIIAILTVAAALLSTQSAFAIEAPNPKGNITVGTNLTVSPGLNFIGDITIANVWIGHITVGGALGWFYEPSLFTSSLYSAASPNYLYTSYTVSDAPHHTLYLAPRATFGINLNKKLQVYAGAFIGAGVNLGYYKHYNDPMAHPGAQFAFLIGEINGIRFFLNDKFALQTELNFGTNYPVLSVGAALKF